MIPCIIPQKRRAELPSVVTSYSTANLRVMRVAAAESSRMQEVTDEVCAYGLGEGTAITILPLLLGKNKQNLPEIFRGILWCHVQPFPPTTKRLRYDWLQETKVLLSTS